MADIANSATCLGIYTGDVGANNHDTLSMLTVHCALQDGGRGNFEVAERPLFENR